MRGWLLVSGIGWVRGVGKFAVGRMLMETHSQLMYNIFRGKQNKSKSNPIQGENPYGTDKGSYFVLRIQEFMGLFYFSDNRRIL